MQPALEAWLTIFDDCLASTNKPQLESMVSVLRGLLALLSPVPGHLGSAIADVEFVYPATLRSPPIYSDVPRLGKLVAQTLRAKEVWATRADYYKKHQGAEVKHTTSFRDLYLLGNTVGAGVRAGTTSHTETDSYIHEFCSRVPPVQAVASHWGHGSFGAAGVSHHLTPLGTRRWRRRHRQFHGHCYAP